MSVATPRATNRVIDALVRRRTELKNNNDRGFSLIELLVVVLIIGVLAAVAIPVYLGSVNSAKQSAVDAAASNAKSQYSALVFEYESDTDSGTDWTDAASKAAADNTKTGEITVTSNAASAGNADAVTFTATHADGQTATK